MAVKISMLMSSTITRLNLLTVNNNHVFNSADDIEEVVVVVIPDVSASEETIACEEL
jgi:hypothetical protein